MSKAQHTPTPWKAEMVEDGFGVESEYLRIESDDSEERFVAKCNPYAHITPEDEANADFIVLACNAHEVLVSRLKDALPHIEASGFDGEGILALKIKEVLVELGAL